MRSRFLSKIFISLWNPEHIWVSKKKFMPGTSDKKMDHPVFLQIVK